MKLKLEIPEGYEVKGFDYPKSGDYVLLPSGEPFKVDEYDHAYHCGGIILKEVWEPGVGKYYEFSDDGDFSEGFKEIKKLINIGSSPQEADRYIDSDGFGWEYIRPVKGEFGR